MRAVPEYGRIGLKKMQKNGSIQIEHTAEIIVIIILMFRLTTLSFAISLLRSFENGSSIST